MVGKSSIPSESPKYSPIRPGFSSSAAGVDGSADEPSPRISIATRLTLIIVLLPHLSILTDLPPVAKGGDSRKGSVTAPHEVLTNPEELPALASGPSPMA